MKALLWPRRGEWLLPSVSGVLLALSFPPLHTLVLPFLGLVPFAVWVHGLSPDQEGRRAAVRGSLVFGSIYFGFELQLTWRFAGLPKKLGKWWRDLRACSRATRHKAGRNDRAGYRNTRQPASKGLHCVIPS